MLILIISERYHPSSLSICSEEQSSSELARTDGSSFVFEVQNRFRRSTAARNYWFPPQGYSFQHITLSVLRSCWQDLPVPWDIQWSSIPIGVFVIEKDSYFSTFFWQNTHLTFWYYVGHWDEGRIFSSQRRCNFAEWSTDRLLHYGHRRCCKLFLVVSAKQF